MKEALEDNMLLAACPTDEIMGEEGISPITSEL